MKPIRRLSLIILFIVTIFVISGCSNNSNELNDLKKSNQELLSKYENLEMEMDKIERMIDDLKEENDSLKTKIKYLSEDIDNDGFSLSVNSEGYDTIVTQNGAFTLSIENVEEYLNGYKVKFRFGNPMNATYHNMKFHVVLNNVASDGKILEGSLSTILSRPSINSITYKDYYNVTYEELEEIKAGSWHNFTVTIPNVTLENIEQLTIVPEFSSMSLYN